MYWSSIVKIIKFIFAPLLVGLFSTSVLAQKDDFCWQSSQTRGVGTVLTDCVGGRDKIGALCYSKCAPNTKRVGFDCHSVCPDGMRDDGLFCRSAEYGRGAGYAIWNEKKCNNENSQGCEKYLALWYPKCKAGYSAFGSNICRPNKPNCNALGMKPGIDLSCAKKVTIGDPIPLICKPGKQEDAGLCYGACKPGYTGVGPVCWGQCQPGYVACGAGCATSKKFCAEIISNQVISTVSLAVNIATLGSSSEATAVANSAKEASRFAKLVSETKAAWTALKATKQYETIKNTKDAISFANRMRKLESATSTEDRLRALAGFDPTGISQVVSAYGHKVCPKP
jgi:hypothetical protein